MGPGTRIKDAAARMFCFYYPLVVCNKRIILRMPYPDDSGRRCRLAQWAFKLWPGVLDGCKAACHDMVWLVHFA